VMIVKSSRLELLVLVSSPSAPLSPHNQGKDIIKQGRQMLGETQPLASKPGSIRGDYSIDLGRNICHGTFDRI
jgi:nucleoside diphosphate kinase